MTSTDTQMDAVTDFARWRRNPEEKPSWDGRNRFIASLIPPHASVLDVGAGAMTLEQYLPGGARYTPMDLVRSSARTVLVNFNAYQIPRLSHAHDFVICSGVLEYIIPVHLFLNTVAGWAPTIILSYATRELNPTATSARTGWLNRFSERELRELFDHHGLVIKGTHRWEQQMIYMLDSTKSVHALFHSPNEISTRPDIASVFRHDHTNVGDWYCAPMHYLDFGSRQCVDIFDFQKTAPKLPVNLIVGGGGLLGSVTFNGCFDRLLEQQFEHIVGWGMGDNSRYDTISGYVERGELVYPAFLKQFSLVGVRDFGTEYPWVPCASCLHPLFAEKWNIENEVVVFEHKRVPIPINDFPKMSNDTSDLARVVHFLGTARVVITNSYHAAYWSQLLGKAVLAFPFSTKFYYFKHKVTLCQPEGWKKYLDQVETQPPALAECVDANLAFWTKVRSLLNLNVCGPKWLQARNGYHVQTKSPPVQVRLQPQEVRLKSPVSETQVNVLLASLTVEDELVILDSENPGFDRLKLRLFERDHIGRDPQTNKQTWRGAKTQRPSCPALQPSQVLPMVVSFFTINTPYADQAKRLKASCEQHGLPCVIEGVPSKGAWEFNCGIKAGFILRKWRELKTPVLWLDADALVRRAPTLLTGLDADFAIHKVDRWQFASGTLFFNQTENARRLLEKWVEKCQESPDVWDQYCLDAAWEEITAQFPLKTFWLPESYTRIFDRHLTPGEDPVAVIEHFQASRELKKVISNRPPTPLKQFPSEFIAARSVSRPTPRSEIGLNFNMNYQQEYDEYWSHPDCGRCHSVKNPAGLADQIENVCGCGSALDVGCGMGLLVRTLVGRGIEARGIDIAQRVVDEGNRSLPGRFQTGSILSLPFADGAFETVISTDCLDYIAEADVPKALHELHRVSSRFVFVQLAMTRDRAGRWHLTIRDRAWWENQFFVVGFRKHPLSQMIVSYEALECESWEATLLFEKIPAAALARYPLTALKAERDLHMDMLREPGRRSDAHIARYMLAREFLPKAGVVLDAACGLGYGSALLAQTAGPSVRVIGLDLSDYAVDYARANFSPYLPNTEFHKGDAVDLSRFADASIDLMTSFETVEHLREPAVFLKEVSRLLKPDGRFICSVPNLWVDETGKDPNPWHFHVFDFAKLAAFIQQFFYLKTAYAQTAGGGMKLPNASRALRQVQFPVTSADNHAEWWLAVSEPKKNLTPMTTSPNILILNQDPTHPLFSSWLADCPYPVKAVQDVGIDFVFPDDTGIFVTANTYHHPNPTLARRAVEQGIPTLVLADGILEYRNTFEHPDLVSGSIFQPVLGHKIACLGKSQARFLESWGNHGKCEIVGVPRLDRYLGLKRRSRPDSEPFRILVMTANSPYFTEAQHETVRASLLALKRFFDEHPVQDGVRLDPIWRLTKGLAEEIGVESRINDLTGIELAKVLPQVDAVITTPSTTMLEGMLLGLPVAALDFCNVPLYVPPAWRITAESQIAATVRELIQPPAPKKLFQEATLHDALECVSPSAPRMVQLVAAMIESGRQAGGTNNMPVFPHHILPRDETSAVGRENHPRLAALYPGEAAFKEDRIGVLQVELAHLRKQILRYECHGEGKSTSSQEYNQKHIFLQYLDSARIVSGQKDQRAVWEVVLNGEATKALMLQPPIELAFDIPSRKAGVFAAQIALHPDVWNNPESGICEFQVQIDRRLVFIVALDPIKFAEDRRWHDIRLDVPANPKGNHQISLRTRSPNAVNSFRWALWRNPRFSWHSQEVESVTTTFTATQA